MYFVDRRSIGETLDFLDGQIELFKGHQSWDSPIEKSALERLAHTMIEAILDVGNMLIDGFIMRDPGSYEDIVDILLDERVITPEMHEGYVKLLPYRKMTVQQYKDIEHEALKQSFQDEILQLELFSRRVRDYLSNELGPVSAFKN